MRDVGTGAFLVFLGILIGYVTIRGLWPRVLLSLLYPEEIEVVG